MLIFYEWFQTSLNLSDEQQRALKEADLSNQSGIDACTKAAVALQRCLESKIEPGTLSSLSIHLSGCLSVCLFVCLVVVDN